MQPGGGAWEEGTLEVMDEIKMIGGVMIQDMELPEVARLVLGTVGSEVNSPKIAIHVS